jgi:hypothetical protein
VKDTPTRGGRRGGSKTSVRQPPEMDVLKPVPRIDAAYLRTASQIVEMCVIESLQPAVLDELVKAARTGAYESALNVSNLCDRFDHPVCPVSAARALVMFLQERGICAQVGRGTTRRLGMEDEIVVLQASWREVAA